MNSTSSSAGTDRPLIPAIVGPTAIGKTAVALELADRFNLEMVSCDSRQIYKYMDIGTAKPLPPELDGRPCHLIDFVEPDQIYSAARYRTEAEKVIAKIFKRGRRPLIVGGTGLYLRALISGLFATPEPDLKLRAELEKLTASELHRRLAEVDPEAAAQIPRGNKVRTVRALEIYHNSGHTKSELSISGEYPDQKYRYLLFGLSCSRQKLYQFINLRVDKMIEDGFVAEVETLREKGYSESPVLRSTLGYREILAYLGGEVDLTGCVALIKQKTRNYAKRQITWFKRVPDLIEIDISEQDAVRTLSERLNKFKLDTLSL